MQNNIVPTLISEIYVYGVSTQVRFWRNEVENCDAYYSYANKPTRGEGLKKDG